ISQNPPLNRVGPDVVEGYGMVRADAVIQAITHPTTSEFTNQVYDLDRRNDSYALKQKVLLFGFDAQVGQAFNFSLDVPATGDFDLIIYDDDYSFSTGRPIVEMSSLTSGLDVDESLLFIPTEAGTYYWSIRAVEGYGSASVSLDILSAPTFLNPTPSDGSTGVSINPSLSLTVSDPDGDLMNVSFYNASDDSSIGNDTNVPSDDTASITWLGLVEGTSYSWYVKINDGILMTKSGSFSFTTLSDNPTWDETPTNQAVEVNDDFRYDLNASDTSGIASWWINDTVSFSIDSNGVIRDKGTLEIGDYWLEVRVYDPYDNYLSATFKVNVFIGIPTPGFLLEYLISGLVVIALVLIVKRRQK
ncbi:MAG: Ig-like domain-containing protein, partial [Candidatus Hermodarchaeota archaeon]